jgi:glycosyltransferase involved in cell wall biosynthesis
MNILFLDQFSDLGGAQRGLLDLLSAVAGRGWRFLVAAPGAGALRDRAVALGADYRQIRSGPYEAGGKSIRDMLHFAAELPGLALEIANLARECRAGVIFVNGPRLLPAACLASQGRIPLVFHAHNYLRQGYAAALAGVSLATAGATVVCCCRFVAEPLRPFVARDRVHIVYNGIESREIPPNDFRPPLWRIGLLGRIAAEKGHLDFIQAARMLPPNARFVICGAPLFSDPAADAYFDRVRQSAAGLPIEFPGWCDDIYAMLSKLDLLVVPSVAGEATPRVILEAYATGIPVVASNCGGIPEIVSDGETGFLTPAGDPVRLAERIRGVFAQPALLQRVTENARSAVRERFTLAQYQTRILSILERAGSSARA